MPCTTGTCRLPSSYAAPSGTSAAAANLNRLYGASPNISPTRERRLGGSDPRVSRSRAVTRDGNLNSRLRPRTARPVSAPIQGLPTQAPAPRTAVAPPRAPLPAAGRALPRPRPGGAALGGTLGAVNGTVAAAQAYGAGASVPQAIAYGGGVGAGSWGGAAAGAAIGGAIAGPPGAIAGGILGGILGGEVGGALGNALGRVLPGRKSTPVDGDAAVAPVVPARDPTGSPFPGGQGYGVLYRVCASGIRAGGPQQGQNGGEVCQSFGSVLGPITGIRNVLGTQEQWRILSSHPSYAATGGEAPSPNRINAYSAEIGSVAITRVIPQNGSSAEADRSIYGDPPGIPGISPANPRPAPPTESPDAPWGPPNIAPQPGAAPGQPPTPAPVPGANPTPQPVGDPPPSQTPAPTPAPFPPGIPQRATPPAPTRAQPAPLGRVGRGATAGTFQAVPLAGLVRDPARTDYPAFGDRVVDPEFGDRIRNLPDGVLEPPGLLDVGLAVGAVGALLPIPRPVGAPLGTAIAIPQAVRNATTNAVSPPATITPNRPGPTAGGCRCNGPILSAISQMSGTPVGQPPAPNPATGQAASLAGILAKLQQMQQFAEKAWESTQAQKILDVLTFIGVMHNAAFLSREVAETMSYMVGNVLNIFGIEDENGSNLDVFGWLGQTVENFFVAVFGQDLVNDARETWKRASAILRSASMIIWTVRSIFDSTQELLEWIGENTGKIGNALKRWGVIGFNAYPWMAERVRSQDRVRRRYKRILDGLETAEDTSSSFAMATGEVISIQEEIGELGEQRQAFNASVRDLTEGAEPDNSAIPTAGDEGVSNAKTAPEVSAADFEPGNPP